MKVGREVISSSEPSRRTGGVACDQPPNFSADSPTSDAQNTKRVRDLGPHHVLPSSGHTASANSHARCIVLTGFGLLLGPSTDVFPG